jgi:hypothetical protein
MPEKLRPRLQLRAPQTRIRIALLLIVPAAIAFNLYVNNIALSRDIGGISFVQPAGWNYHTDTPVIPHARVVHFSASGLANAIREQHGVPLFVTTKYPADKGGLNPLIGVNVFAHKSDDELAPEKLLEAKLSEVQRDSHNALEVIEPIATLPIATLPGARVVVKVRAGKEADGLNRTTVYTLVAGHLSFTIIASDAAQGEQATDAELRDFISSIAVDEVNP